CDALDGSGSATAPGKSPLATSCSVDSYLGLVLLAKATSSHVSVLSLQKAIAFSVSTTVVLSHSKMEENRFVHEESDPSPVVPLSDYPGVYADRARVSRCQLVLHDPIGGGALPRKVARSLSPGGGSLVRDRLCDDRGAGGDAADRAGRVPGQ